jgi:thaumarchaeosortase
MMQSLAKSVGRRLPRKFIPADVFFFLFAMPVALLFVLAPQTFMWFWPGMGNLGRGGFLFVLFFLGFELMDFRKTAKPRVNGTRKIAIAILVILALFYFGAVAAVGQFTDSIYGIGRALGVSEDVKNSWLMATDYMALTAYLVGLAVAFFGWRSIPKIITGIVLSAGMMIFFLLDALFPYDKLWFLQAWAIFIVAAVSFLMRGLGFPVFGVGNSLTISGAHGVWRLFVFWPSVGVESMLIFSLVMIVLAAKLSAPKKRKIIYAVVGAVGTVFLNVVRISIISYYGVCCATSSEGLDAFHNTIGQFLYPVWIIAYLYIVLEIENRLSARTHQAAVLSPGAPKKTLDQGKPPYVTNVSQFDRA